MKKFLINTLISTILCCITSSLCLADTDYDQIYSDCLSDFGTINNGIVLECSSQVIQIAENDLQNKINRLQNTKLSIDFERFIEGQDHWQKYKNIQCGIQAIYVGSPMYGYCPMMMLIERNSELDLLLDSLE